MNYIGGGSKRQRLLGKRQRDTAFFRHGQQDSDNAAQSSSPAAAKPLPAIKLSALPPTTGVGNAVPGTAASLSGTLSSLDLTVLTQGTKSKSRRLADNAEGPSPSSSSSQPASVAVPSGGGKLLISGSALALRIARKTNAVPVSVERLSIQLMTSGIRVPKIKPAAAAAVASSSNNKKAGGKLSGAPKK